MMFYDFYSYPEQSDLQLRETPADKVRERWTFIKDFRENQNLLHDLMETIPNSEEPKKVSNFETYKDNLAVWLCVNFHTKITLLPGDNFYSCASCKRKYALAFVNNTFLDAGVYIPSSEEIPMTQTFQTKCKNGTRGDS